MKIVMINGQNHRGSTYHIGRMLADKLAGPEEITEFFLPRDMNHFCVGCYSCIEDETKCPFFAEKKVILDALQEAELFIFTTPNYCMGPSGAMKTFLDLMFDYWMTHRPKEWMFGKKAVVISTTAGMGAGKAIAMVKESLKFWGVPYIRTYGTAVMAMNWETVKEEKKAIIEKKVSSMAAGIARTGKPYVGIQTRFLFKMMTGMHKSGWDSSPVEKIYWEEHGWLGKKRPWKQV